MEEVGRGFVRGMEGRRELGERKGERRRGRRRKTERGK